MPAEKVEGGYKPPKKPPKKIPHQVPKEEADKNKKPAKTVPPDEKPGKTPKTVATKPPKFVPPHQAAAADKDEAVRNRANEIAAEQRKQAARLAATAHGRALEIGKRVDAYEAARLAKQNAQLAVTAERYRKSGLAIKRGMSTAIAADYGRKGLSEVDVKAEDERLRERDRKKSDLELASWHRADALDNLGQIGIEQNASAARRRSYETLFKTADPARQKIYMEAIEREKAYQVALGDRRTQVEAANVRTAGGAMKWDTDWYTRRDRELLADANAPVRDDATFERVSQNLATIAAQARAGDYVSRGIVDGYAEGVARYAQERTYRMVNAGAELDRAIAAGDHAQVERLLDRIEKEDYPGYKKLMGDPGSGEEGSIAKVMEFYNEYSMGYNAKVQKDWMAKFNAGRSSATIVQESIDRDRWQLQAAADYKKSGSSLPFDQWLESEMRTQRTQQAATVEAANRIVETMNRTVGVQMGRTFKIVMEDGQIGVETQIDKNSPVVDDERRLAEAAKALGYDFDQKDRGQQFGIGDLSRNPKSIEEMVAKAMDTWTREQPGGIPHQGDYGRSTEAVKQSAAYAAEEKRLRAVFGMGDKSLFDKAAESPLGLVFDLANVPLSWVGAGIEDWAYRQGGRFYLTPQSVTVHDDAYRAAWLAETQELNKSWSFDMTPAELDAFKVKKAAIDAKYPDRTKEVGKWGLVKDASELAAAEAARSEYATRSANEGASWRDRLSAYNDLGSNPFADVAGNLLFGFVADPLNYIPLDWWRFAARGAYALSATRDASKVARVPKAAYHWFTVKPEQLRSEAHIARVLDVDPATLPPPEYYKAAIIQEAEIHGVTPRGIHALAERLTPYLEKVFRPSTTRDRSQVMAVVEGELIQAAKAEAIEVVDSLSPPPKSVGAAKARGARSTARSEAAAARRAEREAAQHAKGEAAVAETEARMAEHAESVTDKQAAARTARTDAAKAKAARSAEIKAQRAAKAAPPPEAVPTTVAKPKEVVVGEVSKPAVKREVPVNLVPTTGKKGFEPFPLESSPGVRTAADEPIRSGNVENTPKARRTKAVQAGTGTHRGERPVTKAEIDRSISPATGKSGKQTATIIEKRRAYKKYGIADDGKVDVNIDKALPPETLEDMARKAEKAEKAHAKALSERPPVADVVQAADEAAAGRTVIVPEVGSRLSATTGERGARTVNKKWARLKRSAAGTYVGKSRSAAQREQKVYLIERQRLHADAYQGMADFPAPMPKAESALRDNPDYGIAAKAARDSAGEDHAAVLAVRQYREGEFFADATRKQDGTGMVDRAMRGPDVPLYAGARDVSTDVGRIGKPGEARVEGFGRIAEGRERLAALIKAYNKGKPELLAMIEQLANVVLKEGERLEDDGRVIDSLGNTIYRIEIQRQLAREVLAAGKLHFREVYATLSKGVGDLLESDIMMPLYRQLLAGPYDGRAMVKFWNRAGMIMRAGSDVQSNAIALRTGAEWMFNLFHEWRAAGRLDDIERVSNAARTRIERHYRLAEEMQGMTATLTPDLLPDALWLLMESRVGDIIPTRMPHDVAVGWFMEAARVSGFDPHLSAAMVPSGFSARAAPLQTRLRPLLDAVGRPGFTQTGRQVIEKFKKYVPRVWYANEDEGAQAITVTFKQPRDIAGAMRRMQSTVIVSAEQGGITAAGGAAKLKARLWDNIAYAMLGGKLDVEKFQGVMDDVLIRMIAEEGEPVHWKQIRNVAEGMQGRFQRFAENPLGQRSWLLDPEGKRIPRSLSIPDLSWEAREALWDEYWAAGKGTRKQRRYDIIDERGFIQHMESERYRPREFITHDNAAGHIAAYVMRLQEIDVGSWATASLAFGKHMIKGAGVSREETWDIVRYFHGERIGSAKAAIWRALDTRRPLILEQYQTLDKLQRDARKAEGTAEHADLLVQVADAQQVLQDLWQHGLRNTAEYRLLRQMGEVPTLKDVVVEGRRLEERREIGRQIEANLSGVKKELDDEGVEIVDVARQADEQARSEGHVVRDLAFANDESLASDVDDFLSSVSPDMGKVSSYRTAEQDLGMARYGPTGKYLGRRAPGEVLEGGKRVTTTRTSTGSRFLEGGLGRWIGPKPSRELSANANHFGRLIKRMADQMAHFGTHSYTEIRDQLVHRFNALPPRDKELVSDALLRELTHEERAAWLRALGEDGKYLEHGPVPVGAATPERGRTVAPTTPSRVEGAPERVVSGQFVDKTVQDEFGKKVRGSSADAQARVDAAVWDDMTQSQFRRRFYALRKRVHAAEKQSDPAKWTKAQRAAYDAGDWAKFSRLRGYTPEEIREFALLHELQDLPKAVADDAADFDNLGVLANPDRIWEHRQSVRARPGDGVTTPDDPLVNAIRDEEEPIARVVREEPPAPVAAGEEEPPLPEPRPDDASAEVDAVGDIMGRLYSWADFRRMDTEMIRLRTARKAFKRGTPEYRAIMEKIYTTKVARDHIHRIVSRAAEFKANNAKRRTFAGRVLKRVGADIEDLVPENRIADYAVEDGMPTVELARRLHSTFHGSTLLPGDLPDEAIRQLDRLLEMRPDGRLEYDVRELEVADIHQGMYGKRDILIDQPFMAEDDGASRFRPQVDEPEFVEAKSAHLGSKGDTLWAYDHIRAVSRWSWVKFRTTTQLLDEAKKLPGDTRENFLRLRHEAAVFTGRKLVAKAARGSHYMADDEDILNAVFGAFHPDGTLRKVERELTPIDQYIIEKMYKQVTGGLDITDADTAKIYLAQNRPPDFMTNRGSLHEYLRDNGIWSPRHRRQFQEQARSWAVADQREHFRLNYADEPKWLDEQWLREQGYFDDHEAHLRVSREIGDIEEVSVAEARMKGESLMDWALRESGGDKVKAARTLEQKRKFWIETWGKTVAVFEPGGPRLVELPWLQTYDEINKNLDFVVSKAVTRGSKFVASGEEVYRLRLAVRKAMRDLEDAGIRLAGSPVPVTPELIDQFVHIVTARVLEDLTWLDRSDVDSLFMRILKKQAKWRRALTQVSPSFFGINVPDTWSKGVVRGVQPRRVITRMFDHEGYDVAREEIKRVGDFDRSGESAQMVPLTGKMFNSGSWGDAVFEFFPSKLGAIEADARVRVGQSVFEQVWKDQKRWATQYVERFYGRSATAADQELIKKIAVVRSKLIVREETRSFFPSLTGASYAERLLNEFMPFISYNVRNKVAWVKFAFDNPVWFSRLNWLGHDMDRFNREAWAREHPDAPYPEEQGGKLYLPWLGPNAFLDIGAFSDAKRGLSWFGSEEKSVRNWFWDTFRLLSPMDVAAVHGATDALHLTGSWKWVYDYDDPNSDDAQIIGQHQVWVGDGEPWSGDPVTVSSLLWPVSILENFLTMSKAGIDATVVTRILHQLFFYGDLTVLDPRLVKQMTYFALGDAGKDQEQRDFLTANHDLLEFWREHRLLPHDYVVPLDLRDMYKVERPEPETWLASQPFEFRTSVGQGYSDIEAIYAGYASRLDDAIIDGNWDLARDLRKQRRMDIQSYYVTHPNLTIFEYMTDGPLAGQRLSQQFALDDRTDAYIALLGERPKRGEKESAAAFDARYTAWDASVRMFAGAHPEVVAQLQGSVESIAAAKHWQDLIWERARQRQRDLSMNLDAAKRAGDYEWADLLYRVNDFNDVLFETDVYAGYEGETGKIGRAGLGDLMKNVLNRMTPEQLAEYNNDRAYAAGMKEIIDKAKTSPLVGTKDWEGKEVTFDGALFQKLVLANPTVRAKYFADHPGREAEWQFMGEYMDSMQRFGRLMKNGDFAAAYKYYDGLPAAMRARYELAHVATYKIDRPYRLWWDRFHSLMDAGHRQQAFAYYDKMPDFVRKRYFEEHPEKKAEMVRSSEYARWWDKYFRLHNNGNHDAAFAMYNNMPDWIRARYYRAHPNKKAQALQTGRYMGYMQTWIGMFEAGRDKQAMAYFDGLPQWAKDRYFKGHPGKRDSWGQRSEYSKYMGGWIHLIEQGASWDKSNAFFWKMPEWVRERYFKGHPDSGMRKTQPGYGNTNGGYGWSTAKYKAYKNALGGWINLIDGGAGWDKSNAYFWNMPAWVRATYFKNNPDSGMKKTRGGGQPSGGWSEAKYNAYTDALGGWINIVKTGNWEAANAAFWDMPQWVRDTYFKNNPDSGMKNTSPGGGQPNWTPSAKDKAYVDAMGKWVEFYKAGDTAGAEAYFRSLPEDIQNRYLQKHPDKELMGESLDMVALLTQYLSADPAAQLQIAREHPEVAKWVTDRSTDAQRIGLLNYIFEHLPPDAWLKRHFKEKYPEVFSEEAVGARRAASKWAEAGQIGLVEEMGAWVEQLSKSATEASAYTTKPPKPVTFVHARRRRRHTNTRSAMEVSRAA